MAIIASASVPGSIDQDDTAELRKIRSVAGLAGLVARIDAGPLRLPACPPWCVEHVDNVTDPGFGDAQWHIGERRSSARVFTGMTPRVNGRRIPETKPVTVYAEAYEHRNPAEDEDPGVHVTGLGKLSIEDAMDLATDILRCASELVAAEIKAVRGGRR